MRELLDSSDLPRFDAVEHGETCIRFLWLEQKAVVVIDLEDEPGPDLAA
jgi:hypothetical protein